MEARANAARALGILRGKAAVPDLLAALRSKDTDVIYESLIALQKIRDESAAPGVAFLLRDLDQKVQLAAIETVGLLQNKSSCPAVDRRARTLPQHQGEAGRADFARHARRRKEPRRIHALPAR